MNFVSGLPYTKHVVLFNRLIIFYFFLVLKIKMKYNINVLPFDDIGSIRYAKLVWVAITSQCWWLTSLKRSALKK